MSRERLCSARAAGPATARTMLHARCPGISRVLTIAATLLLALGSSAASAQASPGAGGRQLLLSVPPLIAAVAATGPETITYGYDAKGRLVTVFRDGPVSDVTTGYQHDQADNRTRLITTGSPNPPQP